MYPTGHRPIRVLTFLTVAATYYAVVRPVHTNIASPGLRATASVLRGCEAASLRHRVCDLRTVRVSILLSPFPYLLRTYYLPYRPTAVGQHAG